MSDLSPAAVPPHHRLRFAHLDSLATGRFSRDALATLLSAERSRRLLLLRALRDYAEAEPGSTGPLPPARDAWDLLSRAESAKPEVVNEMLADPQTGTWVAHALRRVRNMSDDKAPPWFHLGQLHTLALAAAVRAGLTADASVPVWDGAILLPSLGCLRLSGVARWSHAEVALDATMRIRCGDTVTEWDPLTGQVSAGSAEWFPLRVLKSNANGLDVVVRLDDLSAYRGLDNPVQPTPLDAADVDRWQALLDDAWALLVRHHRSRADELAIGMTSLVPEPPAFRFRPRSTSVEDAFGGAILSQPYDAAQLAVVLIHEFQHSVLNGVRHLVDLVSGDDPAVGYAPWRDDPRPVGALIHGVFAFTAVAEFWAVQRHLSTGTDADLANFEFALWRHQTAKVFDTIQGHPALTDTGNRFLEGIGTRLTHLATEHVPPTILANAQAAAEDHAAGWRACHLEPSANWVRAVIEAWYAGRSAPPRPDTASTVDPGREVQRLDAKAVLIRVRLTDAELFARLHAEPHLVSGASAADLAYVAGDLEAARQRYLAELSRAPNRAAAWSGLGLTLAATPKKQAAADILLHQPELVREVAAVVADNGDPPLDELATWLAQGAE